MKLHAQIEIENFKVPSTVGFRDRYGRVPLDRLEEHVLSALCDKFRKDIYARAGKEDPRIVDATKVKLIMTSQPSAFLHSNGDGL